MKKLLLGIMGASLLSLGGFAQATYSVGELVNDFTVTDTDGNDCTRTLPAKTREPMHLPMDTVQIEYVIQEQRAHTLTEAAHAMVHLANETFRVGQVVRLGDSTGTVWCIDGSLLALRMSDDSRCITHSYFVH